MAKGMAKKAAKEQAVPVSTVTVSADVFVLDSDLRIGAAPALREALLEKLALGGTVRLDGSAVAQVDTAALQVLGAFVRDAGARDIEIDWLGASDTLHKGAVLLGLNETIQMPAPQPASTR
jgi:phospholipid transport system transporter-binding protein